VRQVEKLEAEVTRPVTGGAVAAFVRPVCCLGLLPVKREATHEGEKEANRSLSRGCRVAGLATVSGKGSTPLGVKGLDEPVGNLGIRVRGMHPGSKGVN